MWEWPSPSENRPMTCTVPPFWALPLTSFQAWPSNILPEAMALETSLAPWSKTRPEPIAL